MKRAVPYILLGCHCLCVASALNAQLIVAHRGASFDAAENTRASYQLAWKQGADTIEGDFHLTSDQQIVCIHDPTTERVSGKNLPVAQSTLAELQRLDIGSWKDRRFADQRMPRLQDVLALVPDGKSVYLEIKCGPEILPFFQRVLSESELLPRQTIVISFREDVIRGVKQAMPERQAYWLVDFRKDRDSGQWSPTADELIAAAKNIQADGVDLNAIAEVVDARMIARCRQAGLSVHVWTIDDPEIAVHYQRLGVDSITTDRPAMLRERLFPPRASLAAPSRAAPVAKVPAVSLPGHEPR